MTKWELFQKECICDTKMVHRPISPGPLRLMCLRLVSQVVQIILDQLVNTPGKFELSKYLDIAKHWIFSHLLFDFFAWSFVNGHDWKSWKQLFSIKGLFFSGDLQLPRMPSSSRALLAPVWSHCAIHSCKADRVNFPTWILIFLTNEAHKMSYRLFQKVRPSILTTKPEGSSAWVPHTALVRQTAQDEAENNW